MFLVATSVFTLYNLKRALITSTTYDHSSHGQHLLHEIHSVAYIWVYIYNFKFESGTLEPLFGVAVHV